MTKQELIDCIRDQLRELRELSHLGLANSDHAISLRFDCDWLIGKLRREHSDLDLDELMVDCEVEL